MRIVSENPIEGIWDVLSQYESFHLAKRLISDRAKKTAAPISSEKLDEKARALAYCLRTARENICMASSSLTTTTTFNYYGCLWLASAIVVADASTDADLKRLESHTISGHGLGNVVSNEGTFPDNEYIYVKGAGFFVQYLTWTGVSPASLSKFMITKSPKTVEDIAQTDRQNLLPMLDLLARIPEITKLFEYVTERPAKNFHVFHCTENHQENMADEFSTVYTSLEGIQPFKRRRDYSWIGIESESQYSEDHVKLFGPPLSELAVREQVGGSQCWTGKLSHQPDHMWGEHPAIHHSAVSGITWITPIFGELNDLLAVHLMLLYQLSILARYRPAVWREILEGGHDQYRTLINTYNRVFMRFVPQIALERIIDERVDCALPGTLNAPIS
jgi:YaaC-like Protein